jgi:hypothetical protein
LDRQSALAGLGSLRCWEGPRGAAGGRAGGPARAAAPRLGGTQFHTQSRYRTMSDVGQSEADSVHAAADDAGGSLSYALRPPPGRCIFFSLRFGLEHGVLPMAETLRAALAPHGITAVIINIAAGGDIDTEVYQWIEHCDTFVVFGSARYGEDTGNQACTFYEYKHAFDRKKRIILIRMIPFGADFEELQGRVIFGANKLMFPWIVGTAIPADLVDQIVKALELRAQPDEPEPDPMPSLAPPPEPAGDAPTPPKELADLFAVTAFQACLAQMGISSLSDFAENFDTQEGHDQMLRAAIESLPTKPKKNKVLKIRMQKALEDLLMRFSVFEQLDEDGDCFIDEEEAKSPLAKKVLSKSGCGNLSERFQSVATEGSVSFPAFLAHFAVVSQGEGEPPEGVRQEQERTSCRMAVDGGGSTGSGLVVAAKMTIHEVATRCGRPIRTVVEYSDSVLDDLLKELDILTVDRQDLIAEARLLQRRNQDVQVHGPLTREEALYRMLKASQNPYRQGSKSVSFEGALDLYSRARGTHMPSENAWVALAEDMRMDIPGLLEATGKTLSQEISSSSSALDFCSSGSWQELAALVFGIGSHPRFAKRHASALQAAHETLREASTHGWAQEFSRELQAQGLSLAGAQKIVGSGCRGLSELMTMHPDEFGLSSADVDAVTATQLVFTSAHPCIEIVGSTASTTKRLLERIYPLHVQNYDERGAHRTSRKGRPPGLPAWNSRQGGVGFFDSSFPAMCGQMPMRTGCHYAEFTFTPDMSDFPKKRDPNLHTRVVKCGVASAHADLTYGGADPLTVERRTPWELGRSHRGAPLMTWLVPVSFHFAGTFGLLVDLEEGAIWLCTEGNARVRLDHQLEARSLLRDQACTGLPNGFKLVGGNRLWGSTDDISANHPNAVGGCGPSLWPKVFGPVCWVCELAGGVDDVEHKDSHSAFRSSCRIEAKPVPS